MIPTTASDHSAIPGVVFLALVVLAALVLAPIIGAEILDRHR